MIAAAGAMMARSVLSADGRWLTCQSTVMGRTDIFVEPFPPTGARYQLPSHDDNHHPLWAPDGGALFFVPGPRRFGRVPITAVPRFGFEAFGSYELNRTAQTGGPNRLTRLDIMPHGKRFVGIWDEELKRLMSR